MQKIRDNARVTAYIAIVGAILCSVFKIQFGLKICLLIAGVSLIIQIIYEMMSLENKDEIDELTTLRKVVRYVGGLIILLLILFTQ